LHFPWDEVHDIAEQLEHIKSDELINKLADYLGNPSKDPHGDPIPDSKGNIITIEKVLLSELQTGQKGICVGVKDSSAAFLKYLDTNKIALGSSIKLLMKEDFDLSLKILIDTKEMVISNKIASNLFVKLI
jgi:DtxR family transcriptional regulator, Mn-dependent transcriptional regulator